MRITHVYVSIQGPFCDDLDTITLKREVLVLMWGLAAKLLIILSHKETIEL